MKQFDILIVGYGPAGATFGNLMAKRGYSVALIDSATEIYDKPRAITADHEALRIFQECGLADEIARDTQPHPGTDFVGVDGDIIKRFYPAPPPQLLAWEPSWMFVQPELEASLRKGIKRYASAKEFLGHELVHFEDTARGVEARLRRLSDNETIVLRGRYLIGCDGGRSQVRRTLQSTIDDLQFDEWWMVVDAWIRGPVTLPERCVQYCRPSRPGTYIVGPDNLRRWEIKILPGENPESYHDHEKVMGVLGDFVDTAHLEICRVAIYRFHALVVEYWRQGNVFLMGDAAHQMPPFMGQGLCAAIRDAVNLAWKLDGVERLGYSPTILDSYGTERKQHVRTVVSHAKSFGQIIGELDLEKARRRDKELIRALESGEAETIRQRFIPDLETGLIDDGPGGGELFVQPWIRCGSDVKRMDDLLRYGFLVVARSEHILRNWLCQDAHEILERIDAECVVVQPNNGATAETSYPVLEERDGLFTAWMDKHDAGVAIVRPDRYVYATAGNAQELLQKLQKLHRSLYAMDFQGAEKELIREA